MNKKFLLLSFLFVYAFSGFAQNKPSTWFELEFSKEVIKNLKIEFNPELRYFSGFKMDSYILEGGLSYKLNKYVSFAGYYRYEDSYDYKKKSGAYKGQQSLNRFAFDIKPGFKVNRFDFLFRIRYTKGIDINNKSSELRYRAKIDYDIKGSKFVPFISIELFHDNSILATDRDYISGGLKSVDKIRYTGGLTYDINKNNEIDLFYRLQDNRIKDATVNILGLGYSHDF